MEKTDSTGFGKKPMSSNHISWPGCPTRSGPRLMLLQVWHIFLKKTEVTLTQNMYLDRIVQAANNMLSIINDILDFSKE